jgi:hypothetical protein
LRNVVGRATELAAGQRRDLRLGRLAEDGGPDPGAVLVAFDARVAGLDMQRSTVMGTIASRIEARLPGLLAERGQAWKASLLALLAPRVDDAVAEALTAGDGDGPVRNLLDKARDSLERAGREMIGTWLERREAEVLELLTGLAANEIGTLLELARSPAVTGARMAGLASGDDRRDLMGWSAEDLPDVVIRSPAWTVPVQQPRRPWRRNGPAGPEARDRLDAALAAAADAFTEHVRVASGQAAREWAERLDEQAVRQTRQSADRFRRCLHAVPRDEDLAALEGLIARLAVYTACAISAETVRVTEEESRAHLDVLRLLAGRSALTQPWADQESAWARS